MKGGKCYMYVLECGGLFKVGISGNPDERLKQLRKVPALEEIKIIMLFEYGSREEAKEAEAYCHLALNKLNCRFINKAGEVVKFGGYTEFFKSSSYSISFLKEMVETELEAASISLHDLSSPLARVVFDKRDYDFYKWLKAET